MRGREYRILRLLSLAVLALPGCRRALTDRVESAPPQHLDTTVGRPLAPEPREQVALQRQSLSVELHQERRCILVRREEVKTVTSYRLEPIDRPVVLAALAGALVGGYILADATRCKGGGLCDLFTPPQVLLGGAFLIPSGSVLASQLLAFAPGPTTETRVVSSEQAGSCGQEPRASASFELRFPSGTRLAGVTDARGRALLPLSDENAGELRQGEGKVMLSVESEPSRQIVLSGDLSALAPPAPASSSPGRLREPRRNQSDAPELRRW